MYMFQYLQRQQQKQFGFLIIGNYGIAAHIPFVFCFLFDHSRHVGLDYFLLWRPFYGGYVSGDVGWCFLG